MFGRKKIAMLVAEFLGTATLAVAVFSMARYPNIISIFPAIAAGLTLGLMVLIIGDISGSHINPAVTFGLWSLRKISSIKALAYVAVQMLGGVAAFLLLKYLTTGTLFPMSNMAGKNLDAKIIISEAIGTFIFTFGIAAAVYKGFQGVQKAFTIGGSLTLGILVASFASNAVLNPAVAVGINSFSASYVLGPLIGAVIGMNFYTLVFTDLPAKRIRSATVAKKSSSTSSKKKKK